MADLQDPQSMDNRKLSAIAQNPNHPMHTHAKSELDRRKMKNEGVVNEDGHSDVPSAIRGCKTTMEDAMQIMKKLLFVKLLHYHLQRDIAVNQVLIVN